jgi:hypothetical protein
MVKVLCRSFRAWSLSFPLSRGDALRCAQHLPLAISIRAFGAQESINQFHKSILLHFQVESAIYFSNGFVKVI